MAWTGQRLKAYYSAGGILWVFCGAGILILPMNMSAFMYVLAIFVGIANALMMVCCSNPLLSFQILFSRALEFSLIFFLNVLSVLHHSFMVAVSFHMLIIIAGYWNKHAKCAGWRRSEWLCICLRNIELLGQNVMWDCRVCSPVISK